MHKPLDDARIGPTMSTHEPHAPKTILQGRYELIERLGAGGMATVFRARDHHLQRDVAIKLLHENWIHDAAFLARFLQEARSAANLSHPNIITVFDFGQDHRRYYIVMEYVAGTDLKTLLRRQGPFSVQEALRLMHGVCAGVGYAHRAGLVHCDLKPQNILVTEDGVAKITDFGIARALAAISPDEKAEVVWGSPKYFAPEQAAGLAPSPASDVYALGAILYELLCGRPPFLADSAEGLAEMHLRNPPERPRSLRPDIPPNLEMIILKVLSKEPSARYRSADQLGRVLDNIVAAPPQPSEKASLNTSAAPQERAEMETIAMTPAWLQNVDWRAVLLALLAFLAAGGLLPLWLWVCLLYPACPINPG